MNILHANIFPICCVAATVALAATDHPILAAWTLFLATMSHKVGDGE